MGAPVTISDVSSILHLSHPLTPPNFLPTLGTIPILNSSSGSWPGLSSWMWPWHCLWRHWLTLRTRKGTESGGGRQPQTTEPIRDPQDWSQRVQILVGLGVLRASLAEALLVCSPWIRGIVVRVRSLWGSSFYFSSFSSSFHPSTLHPSSGDWGQHRPGSTTAQCCTLPH